MPNGQQPSTPWRDLRLRVLSAVLLAPTGLFCIWYGGWIFAALVIFAITGLGREWATLVQQRVTSLRGVTLLVWPAVSCLAALLTVRWGEAVLMLGAPLVLGVRIGFGTIVIGLAGLSLLWLRLGAIGDWSSVLFLVLVVWASDSFAYIVGRAVGGRRLAPNISPSKTWSGSIGGLIGAAIVGVALALALATHPGSRLTEQSLSVPIRGLLVGVILGAVSQAGDLAESAFKRWAGVKDSGRLIPGHGGLLDRLDGLVAAAPVAALLSLAAPPGVGFWYAFLER